MGRGRLTARSGEAVDGVAKPGEDVLDGSHAGDAVVLALAAVMLRDGRRLGVVHVDSLLDHGRVGVIRPSTGLRPLGEPVPEFVFFHLEREHTGNGLSLSLQEAVQCLGLGRCSGKPVKDAAILAVRLLNTLLHQHHNNIVRDQAT